LTFDEGLNVARVNEVLCQGCGACAAICPSSSASVAHFTDRQVMDELEAVLSLPINPRRRKREGGRRPVAQDRKPCCSELFETDKLVCKKGRVTVAIL
jgi:ferredoxin